MRVKYQYHLILYFLVALSILALAFVMMSHKQEISYQIKAMKAELVLYNDIARKTLSSNRPYDSIPAPANIRFTLLDTNKVVLYDNFNHALESTVLTRKELSLADQYGVSTLLRKSQTLESDFLFYVKKYPDAYIRTAIACEEEIFNQVTHERHSIYIITLLFILLAGTILFITHKLTRPIRALGRFIQIVNSPDKDFSKITVPNDEFGEVCKTVIDTFDQFEKAKLYKQQLSQNVSHELKTPLTAVRAYLETILNSPEMDKQQIIKFTEKAYIQAIRLTSLIYDVATLNKLDERSDTFQNEEVVISDCIEEIRNELGHKLAANKVSLDVLFSSNLKLNGCYTLIYSLFKNLIDNSIEHNSENIAITVSAGINQIPGDGGYRIDFTYRDTGKGIPEENIPRIFERFYRIEAGRTRKRGGSGLGLAIVKCAVAYHRGDIAVENHPDGGIIFKFHLYSL